MGAGLAGTGINHMRVKLKLSELRTLPKSCSCFYYDNTPRFGMRPTLRTCSATIEHGSASAVWLEGRRLVFMLSSFPALHPTCS